MELENSGQLEIPSTEVGGLSYPSLAVGWI